MGEIVNSSMDILLIGADHQNKLANFPWSIFSLGSYLRHQGYAVELLDANVDGAEASLERIDALAAHTDLIGLTCMSTDIPYIKKALDRIKKTRPQCRIILGGAHPTLLPEQTCRYDNIDFVCYGEGEESTARLIDELRLPNPDFSRVPGIIYKVNGDLVRTPPAPPAPHYDMDYSLLDPRVQEKFSNYVQVLTGRGCNFKCTFCYNSIIKQPHRSRPIEEVMDEIGQLVERYDPKIIYFRDDHFFSDRKRIPEFVRLYKERGFTFRWRTSCRATDLLESKIDDDLLREMEAIGCDKLKFGFESGSDRILKALKKGIRVEHIKKAVLRLRNVPKIGYSCSFMTGLPGESRNDYEQTLVLIDWMRNVDEKVAIIGPVQFMLFPGGMLYDQAMNDYNLSAANSFEEWNALYDGADYNFLAKNEGRHFPWIAPGDQFIVDNASAIVTLARDDWMAYQRPIKKVLLRPLRWLVRQRLKRGWLKGLIDVRLALFIRRYSIWEYLKASPSYNAMREQSWFKAVRKTPPFALVRWLLG